MDIAALLEQNNWYLEDEVEEGFDFSAGFINDCFYIFLDIKQQKNHQFAYKLTQILQNREDKEIFSCLHYFTNEVEDVIQQLGNLNIILSKENFSESITTLLKRSLVILADDLNGNLLKLAYKEHE